VHGPAALAYWDALFYHASTAGSVQLTAEAMRVPEVNAADGNNLALKTAVAQNNLALFELLLTDARVRTALDSASGRVVSSIVTQARLAMLRALLALPEAAAVFTGFAGVVALRFAAYDNLPADAAALLALRNRAGERVIDPGEDTNLPLRIAAERGHLEVVAVLLADPRISVRGVAFANISSAAVRALLERARAREDQG